MKKLFSLFAICCFVVSSTIVLCACRLPAASFVHSPKKKKTICKRHSNEQMKNRRIRIRLTCTIVYLLFAMRFSFALYILHSIVFRLFGMVCAPCVDTLYSVLCVRQFHLRQRQIHEHIVFHFYIWKAILLFNGISTHIFSQILVPPPPATASVPKLNWMILLLRANNNKNNFSGVVALCT